MSGSGYDGFPHEFSAIAEGIRTMEIRGAALIAVESARALKLLAGTGADLDMLEEAGRLLFNTRPTAISLENAVSSCLTGAGTPQEVAENADRFIGSAIEGKHLIGRYGAERIEDGGAYITHCNSSAALSVFKAAVDAGKRFDVFATETRPWRQGLITVRELAEMGIGTHFIVDSASRHIMGEMNIKGVFVGADTICSNGVVINKIGTSMLALAAHEARIPVYVCAESFKFSPETLHGKLVPIEERPISEVIEPGEVPDVTVHNPVFDATPSDYISAIITEKGVIPPEGAYDLIMRFFGGDERWTP